MLSPAITTANGFEAVETTLGANVLRAIAWTMYVPGTAHEWNELVAPGGVHPENRPSPQLNEY
jgi:hypothetical protein